jgi:hypothetical protein
LLSSTRSPRGSAALPARARTARAVLSATLAAVAAAALAVPAEADLAAVGPVDPATQVPAWFQDATGLKLGLCLDGPPFCLGAVGDFNLPDGEAFYWNAGADLASGSLKAKLVLAQEAVSPPSGPAAFMRVRVRITGGLPDTAYTATQPFGTTTVTTNAQGTGTATVDAGCTVAPCATFAGAVGGAIGPFLRWDPTVSPAVPPGGYVGDAATPHRVTGSPTNNNVFRLTGGGVSLSTDEFIVAGKLAGPPVPVFHGPAGLDFGGQALGTPTAARGATVTSFGVPDPAGASNLAVSGIGVSGPAAADFRIVSSTCGGAVMPSGAACAIGVQFVPSAAGPRTASLDVATNAASGVSHIALAGDGVDPRATAAVAAAAFRARFKVAKLRTTHRMSRARVLRRGLRLSMRLPQGAEIIKISVLRVGRNGRVDRRPVWLAYRVLPSRAGLYRLSLDSRALRRRLKAGLYQINVTPGLSKHQLGGTATTRIRITRH